MTQYNHLKGLRKIKYNDLGRKTLIVEKVLRSWEHGQYIYTEVKTNHGIYKISVRRNDFWSRIYINGDSTMCELRYSNWFKTERYYLKKFWGIG